MEHDDIIKSNMFKKSLVLCCTYCVINMHTGKKKPIGDLLPAPMRKLQTGKNNQRGQAK